MEHIGVLWHFKLEPENVIAFAMIDKDGNIPWTSDPAKLIDRRKDRTALLQILRRAEPESVEEMIKIGTGKGWHNVIKKGD